MAYEYLRKRSDFLTVAASGQKWATPGVVLQAYRRPLLLKTEKHHRAVAESLTRVGFIATRKLGGAVIRNRAKRRLRAAVKEVFPNKAATGYDIVLIARTEILKRPFAQLKSDLYIALKRVGAVREKK